VTSPDDDFVRLAIGGHRQAFDVLVTRMSRLVWAHLVLRCRDRAAAEDMTQETFLRAWRSIGRLEKPATFRGWLMAIAERVRLDTIKHATRQKRATPVTADADIDPPSNDSTPSEKAEANELGSRAIDALNTLPTQYQQALSLRYLAGADYDEISRQLALTNGSLRGLLHRGLAMLRERLTRHTVTQSHGGHDNDPGTSR
jgi:RNA polymerase sigma-70 factor (ECF subfamily)